MVFFLLLVRFSEKDINHVLQKIVKSSNRTIIIVLPPNLPYLPDPTPY